MAKLRFGIIGMGHRGKAMFDLVSKNENTEITAVCDSVLSQLSEYKKAGIKIYSDYKEVMKDAFVDAVFITSPDYTHGDITISALRSGKQIICEKPLEITEEKINEIVYESKKHDKVIALGYVLRYAPLFIKAKKIIESGVIGKIINVHAIDNINYGGYAFFHDWHRDKRYSTSLILQKATHSLDIINWMIDSRPIMVAGFGGLDVFGKVGAIAHFGKEVDKSLRCSNCPKENECEESIINVNKIKGVNWRDTWPDSCVYSSEVNVEDNQSMIIKYQNNTKAAYTLNLFTPERMRSYIFIGDKGRLEFDDESNVVTVTYRNSKVKDTIKIASEDGHGGGDEGLLEDFVECCKSGEKPVASLEQGAISAILALAAQKSIDEERMVKIEYKF